MRANQVFIALGKGITWNLKKLVKVVTMWCGAVQDQNGEEVLLKPIKLVYYGCGMYYRYQFQGRYQIPSYSYTLCFVVYSFYNIFCGLKKALVHAS